MHGGLPKDPWLPDTPSATVPTFIDAIEELLRLGFRKRLSMKEGGKKLRQAEYWEHLVFSKLNQSCAAAGTILVAGLAIMNLS